MTLEPEWLEPLLKTLPDPLPGEPAGLMDVAITVLEAQVERRTGGPFAALVVENETGRLVSAGVNRVVPCQDCTAHAEMVAIRAANAKLGRYDLAGSCTLVTTAQMCGMCLTASIWSGVSRIIVGARASDTEELTGLDEGVIAADWSDQLRRRGIEVVTDVGRERVRAAFGRYMVLGGIVYNGDRGSSRA